MWYIYIHVCKLRNNLKIQLYTDTIQSIEIYEDTFSKEYILKRMYSQKSIYEKYFQKSALYRYYSVHWVAKHVLQVDFAERRPAAATSVWEQSEKAE